ncbi:MAG: hypothetical protein WD423_05800 [Rhodothermales bacterium]
MTGVTGATGHLGRLVIEALLERGVEPSGVAQARAKIVDRDISEGSNRSLLSPIV